MKSLIWIILLPSAFDLRLHSSLELTDLLLCPYSFKINMNKSVSRRRTDRVTKITYFKRRRGFKAPFDETALLYDYPIFYILILSHDCYTKLQHLKLLILNTHIFLVCYNPPLLLTTKHKN